MSTEEIKDASIYSWVFLSLGLNEIRLIAGALVFYLLKSTTSHTASPVDKEQAFCTNGYHPHNISSSAVLRFAN